MIVYIAIGKGHDWIAPVLVKHSDIDVFLPCLAFCQSRHRPGRAATGDIEVANDVDYLQDHSELQLEEVFIGPDENIDHKDTFDQEVKLDKQLGLRLYKMQQNQGEP